MGLDEDLARYGIEAMITICEWPDGTWCELEDLAGYLQWMSDDFLYKTMPYHEFTEKYE